MPTNPLIEFLRNPVDTLAWVGYLLIMLAILAVAVPWAVRKTAWLIARYQADRASDAWWSFGDRRQGYIPPTGWLANLFAVLFVLAVASWALGTVFWMVG